MKKRPLTEFGKEIKLELVLQNKTQDWLIQTIRQQTDRYVDTSILYKIMTGQVHSSGLEYEIRKALSMTIPS